MRNIAIFLAIALMVMGVVFFTTSPTAAPARNTSPIGSITIERDELRGKPGHFFDAVISLTTTGASSFVFPGYLCSTETDPYGIGHVTTTSGGIHPDATTIYSIEIWPDSMPGESCEAVVAVWLYMGEQKYELTAPVTIVVE